MKRGYKVCPFCANEIKDKAIKCQFCGEFLDDGGSNTNNDGVISKKSINKNIAIGNVYYDIVKTIRCPSCGYVGNPKELLRGNSFVGFILYRFAIIPGIIFSIWRRKKTICCCPVCGNSTIEITKKKSENEIKKNTKSQRKRYIIGFMPLIIIFIIIIITNNKKSGMDIFTEKMQNKGYNIEFSVKLINDYIYNECADSDIRATAKCVGTCEEGNIEVNFPCRPYKTYLSDYLCDDVLKRMEEYNVKEPHNMVIHMLIDGEEVYSCSK